MDLERRYKQLLERHGNGDLDRRGFLGNVGRMALACGVVAPTFMTFARSAHAGETIRYDGFGGYAQEAFDRLKPFTQKTGITVIQGSYANPDAMLAQIRPRATTTIISSRPRRKSPRSRSRAAAGTRNSTKARSEIEGPDPLRRRAQQDARQGKLLSCRTTSRAAPSPTTPRRSTAPKSRPRASAFCRHEVQREHVGLRQLAVPDLLRRPAKRSGSQRHQGLRRDLGQGSASKRQVLKYFTSGAEQDALLTSGNVVLTDAWFLSIYNLMKQGQQIDFWPREGGYTQFGTMIALKGCPLDAFYEIIDILLRPEVCFAHSMATGNLPLLDPTKYEFPKELKAMPGYNPTGVATAFRTFDPIYWEANSANWKRDYSRVMARG
jgi:spermidine/putrescine transport system substrate-binding protein